jgi:hypothetical protein
VTKYASAGIMKRGIAHMVKPLGVESVSTTGSTFEVGEAGSVYVPVVVMIAGTTLLVVIEGSAEGSTWFTIGQIGLSGFVVGSAAAAPTSITGTGTYPGVFPTMQFMRYRSVVSGSWTYSIVFEADKPPF